MSCNLGFVFPSYFQLFLGTMAVFNFVQKKNEENNDMIKTMISGVLATVAMNGVSLIQVLTNDEIIISSNT